MPPLRYIAPSGTVIGLPTLLGAAIDTLLGGDARKPLTAAIGARYGVPHCLTVSSGRAALTLIFRSLARLRADPRRDEILLPGYTCYSVAAGAILAGLRVRIVDIDPATLSYDRAQLDNADTSRVLALVSANLYGLPNELGYLETFARARGIFMVDDAAQAMHASYEGRPVGSFGDVGIYSFDKGKNITSLQGGAIVTRDDAIAAELSALLAELPEETTAATAANIAKLTAYTLLLRPWLYWIPANIPALGLGKTIYTTDMPMHRLSRFAGALALRLFARIDAITAERVRRAARVRAALVDCTRLGPVAPLPHAAPVYLRQPCLAHAATERDKLIMALNQAGIGATGSFPQALGDLPDIAAHRIVEGNRLSGARAVAARIITLPTLAYVNEADVRRLVFAVHSGP